MLVERTSTPARRITLADAKSQLNVLTTRDDDYITRLVNIAEESIMDRSNKVFSEATFKFTFYDVSGKVMFPRYPVYNSETSPITSVKGTTEENGTLVDLVEGVNYYIADNSIIIMDNECYTTLEVVTPCGYNDEDWSEAKGLEGCVLMMIGELYANRQSSIASVVTAIPYGIEFMLAPNCYVYQ